MRNERAGTHEGRGAGGHAEEIAPTRPRPNAQVISGIPGGPNGGMRNGQAGRQAPGCRGRGAMHGADGDAGGHAGGGAGGGAGGPVRERAGKPARGGGG